MKLVQCIIRQEKVREVIEALSTFVPCLTLRDVRGHGRQRGHTVVYRGIEYVTDLRVKLMIEIAIDDTRLDDVIKVVREAAQTGHIGDGRIFVLPVIESYHIRTGFMDS